MVLISAQCCPHENSEDHSPNRRTISLQGCGDDCKLAGRRRRDAAAPPKSEASQCGNEIVVACRLSATFHLKRRAHTPAERNSCRTVVVKVKDVLRSIYSDLTAYVHPLNPSQKDRSSSDFLPRNASLVERDQRAKVRAPNSGGPTDPANQDYHSVAVPPPHCAPRPTAPGSAFSRCARSSAPCWSASSRNSCSPAERQSGP